MAPTRPTRTKIADAIRHRIICLRLDQLSYNNIARRTGLSKSTIRGIIVKFRTAGNYRNAKPQRQKKMDNPMLRRLQRELDKSPRAPLADITNSSFLNVSRSTIYEGLQKFGYKSQMASVKLYHDRQSRRARLGWCKPRKRWGLMEWRNKIWSDEVVV